MTYFFETYGCQMNRAESASVEQLLMQRNWTAAKSAKEADLVIINTCSVRITAETRIHGRLGWYLALKRARAENPPVLIVMGCMAERLKDSLKAQFPVVDYVVGTFQKQHFSDIIDAIEQGRPFTAIDEEPVYTFAPLSLEKEAFQAFVPIMHGCNNFCSYCIVPYVRGREVSRPEQDILTELDQLSRHKVREIVLLGQNVNSYRHTDASGGLVDFPLLLRHICQHLRDTDSSIKWIRFMSSHPKDFSDSLIQVIKDEPLICRHIHLPVQHGSSAILSAMNRKYTREQYLELVKKIRASLPDASLSTDILLGFPGETDDDFKQTLSLMQQVGFETAFMYYYNPREGTVACSLPNQISLKLKKERLAELIELQHAIIKQKMSERLGQTVMVLVDGVSRDNKAEMVARTEQDQRVVFVGDKTLAATFVTVKLTELTGNTFRGIMV